jgi:hypothetical protein
VNKKFFFCVFAFLLLGFALSFVLAVPLDDFAGRVENASRTIEETGQKVDRMTKEDVKWEYLSERWKELLLKNKYVAFADGVFRKGNFIFVVLFGRNYELSLTLLFVIFIWVYFWSQFDKILSGFSTFSRSTCLVLSFGMAVILAQARFFDLISQLLFKLIFYREGAWGWLWSVGTILAIVLVSMVFSRFFLALKEISKKHSEELEKMEGKKWLNIIKLYGKAISDSLGGKK